MPSAKSQFKNELKKMCVYDEKKFGKDEQFKQEHIFSTTTFNNYCRGTSQFVDYCKTEGIPTRSIEQLKQYVPQYLEYRAEHCSAWTVHGDAAALAKAYHCKSTDFGINLPKRERVNIERGRTTTEYSKHFSEKANSELVNFCKSTGLRRSELERLKGSQITKSNDNNYVIEVKGKGGRVRTLLVHHQDEKVLESAVKTIEKHIGSDDKVFGHVSKAANIHGYRAEYAKNLYEKYARDTEQLEQKDLYVCRKEFAGDKFDRQALDKVTQALGHNRFDVCVNNYLHT